MEFLNCHLSGTLVNMCLLHQFKPVTETTSRYTDICCLVIITRVSPCGPSLTLRIDYMPIAVQGHICRIAKTEDARWESGMAQLGGLQQQDHESEANLDCIVRLLCKKIIAQMISTAV